MLWFKVQVMVQELAPRVLKGSDLQAQSLHYTKNHIYSVHADRDSAANIQIVLLT